MTSDMRRAESMEQTDTRALYRVAIVVIAPVVMAVGLAYSDRTRRGSGPPRRWDRFRR